MNAGKLTRVAVASDQDIYRRGLVSLMMSTRGIQLVGEAKSGEEAIQLCELVEPDIFLMDLKNLQEGGEKLIQLIHQRWPQIQVVFLVGVQEESRYQGNYDSGVIYQFPKDITEEELAAAIQQIGQGSLPSKYGSSRDSTEPEYHQPLTEKLQSEELPALDLTPVKHQNSEIISRELIMAGKIQTDILPEKVPSIPGWDISAKLEPARETSGDFYDFIPLANKNWGIMVADVSEKGMGAALFMALASTLFRTYAVRYPSLPAIALDVVNERILSDTRGSMFITAFYGVFEPHTGRFRFANAGHPPAHLISTQKGKRVDRLRPTGMALGVMENAHWQQKIIKLSPGDVLLLYTDGITEAQNPQGAFFGEQRLLDVARAKSGCSAREIQDAVLNDVHQFVADTPRQDDIALIVVRREV